MPDHGKIVWLASYPKSGNTWVRLFLSALLKGVSDINKLKTDGIFSGRHIFESATGLESRYFYHTEIKKLMPGVFRAYAKESADLKFVKVHDAYCLNQNNEPIIPADVSQAVVYIIRNPLDLAASLSNHFGEETNERAVKMITDKNAHLSEQKDNQNTEIQFSQLLMNWSAHVTSWTKQTAIPVITIRYEDLLQFPVEYFTKIISFLNLPYSQTEIEEAVNSSTFSNLSAQEKKSSFKERTVKAKQFFRKGTANNWQEELTAEQAQTIWDHEKEVMMEFGYDIKQPTGKN